MKTYIVARRENPTHIVATVNADGPMDACKHAAALDGRGKNALGYVVVNGRTVGDVLMARDIASPPYRRRTDGRLERLSDGEVL